ncbi:hypothetical protein [Gemmatimonas sp.]|uniref:hypothetical protein n=1 Tax=Gemmatimonas sp. TaxID=1962908 RepID=UPI003F71FC18
MSDAWCLELHDLWISKAVAGWEKDREFCSALLRQGAVNPERLSERLERVPTLDPAVIDVVRSWILT